jgi:hypothetical protein
MISGILSVHEYKYTQQQAFDGEGLRDMGKSRQLLSGVVVQILRLSMRSWSGKSMGEGAAALVDLGKQA